MWIQSNRKTTHFLYRFSIKYPMIWNNSYNTVMAMQLNLFFVVVHCMKLWIGIPGAIAILGLGGGYGPVIKGSSHRTYRVRKSKTV